MIPAARALPRRRRAAALALLCAVIAGAVALGRFIDDRTTELRVEEVIYQESSTHCLGRIAGLATELADLRANIAHIERLHRSTRCTRVVPRTSSGHVVEDVIYDCR